MTKEEQAKLILTKYDLMFESRLSKTENSLENLNDTCKELKSDMRWLIGMMFGGFTGLFGMMVKGFHWF